MDNSKVALAVGGYENLNETEFGTARTVTVLVDGHSPNLDAIKEALTKRPNTTESNVIVIDSLPVPDPADLTPIPGLDADFDQVADDSWMNPVPTGPQPSELLNMLMAASAMGQSMMPPGMGMFELRDVIKMPAESREFTTNWTVDPKAPRVKKAKAHRPKSHRRNRR